MAKMGIKGWFDLQQIFGPFFGGVWPWWLVLELQGWLIEVDMSNNQLYEAFEFLIFLEDYGYSTFQSWLDSNNIWIRSWYNQYDTVSDIGSSDDEAMFYHYLNNIEFPFFVEFLESRGVTLKDYSDFIEKLEICCTLPLECSSEYDSYDNNYNYYDNNLQAVPNSSLIS